MKDMYSNIAVKPVIAPAAYEGSPPQLVSAIIDHRGFASATYAIVTGNLTDSNATYSVLLEESNSSDMASANAVADADMIGTEAAAGFTFAHDGEVRKLGYVGSKRYTQLTITQSGVDAGNSPIAAVAIMGHPAVAPVA